MRMKLNTVLGNMKFIADFVKCRSILVQISERLVKKKEETMSVESLLIGL